SGRGYRNEDNEGRAGGHNFGEDAALRRLLLLEADEIGGELGLEFEGLGGPIKWVELDRADGNRELDLALENRELFDGAAAKEPEAADGHVILLVDEENRAVEIQRHSLGAVVRVAGEGAGQKDLPVTAADNNGEGAGRFAGEQSGFFFFEGQF